MSDPAHIGYIQTVEQLFVLLRRQGLMLSPEDLHIARHWAEADIPLRVACTAIVEAVERYREQRGADASLPSTLRYFAHAVQDAAEQDRNRRILATSQGEAPNIPESGDGSTIVEQLIEELVMIGQSETDSRVRAAYRETYTALKELRNETEGALLPRLLSLDAQLLATLWDSLQEDEQDAVDKTVEARISNERDRLGVKGLEDRMKILRDEALTARFDLFRLWSD